MHALMDLVAEALTHHGYRVTRNAALEGRSGTVYTIPVLAEGDEAAYLVDGHIDGVVPASILHDLTQVQDDVGADGCVMVHLEAIEHHDTGVALWGRDDLIRLLGEAALAKATEIVAAPPAMEPVAITGEPPVAESLEDLLPPAFQGAQIEASDAETDEVPDLDEGFAGLDFDALGSDESLAFDDGPVIDEGEMPAPKPAADFEAELDELVGVASDEEFSGLDGLFDDEQTDSMADIGDELGGLAGLLSDSLGDETEATVPTPAQSFAGVTADAKVAEAAKYAHPLLPVLVTPQEAAGLCREKVFDVRAVEMILQPVYLLDYECDLLAEGSLRYDTVAGRLQVDGTHKTVIEVAKDAVDPSGFSKLTRQDLPVQEKTLRISEDRAKERSRSFLLEAHTRVVDVEINEDDAGFSYTEKRKVAPRPDHIRLAMIGVFHRISWRVIGPNGHVDVDGLTGNVLESLASPDPGVYIMD